MAIIAQADIQQYSINGVNGGPVLSDEIEILTETPGLILTKMVVYPGTTNPISVPFLGDNFDILYDVIYSESETIADFNIFTLTDDVFKAAAADYITLSDPTSIEVNDGTSIAVIVTKDADAGTMIFEAASSITEANLTDGINIRIPAKAISVETTSTVNTTATFSTTILLSAQAPLPGVAPTEDALVVDLDSPQKNTIVAIGDVIVYNLTLSNVSLQNELSIASGEQVMAAITGFTVDASWTDTYFEVDGTGNIVAKAEINLDASGGTTASISIEILGTRTA